MHASSPTNLIPVPPKDIPAKDVALRNRVHRNANLKVDTLASTSQSANSSNPSSRNSRQNSVYTSSSAPANLRKHDLEESNSPLSPSLKVPIPALSKFKSTATPVIVAVRVRPSTINELTKKEGVSSCVEVIKNNGAQQIRIKSTAATEKEFTYDAVFAPEDGQRKVYELVVRGLIDRCLEGYNGCIFAYGQTASGKTYTIQGPDRPSPDQYGIMQRVAEQIINYVQKSKGTDGIQHDIRISYLEIYQEKLIDLLAGADSQSELRIRQDSDGSGLYVQGITERSVAELNDITTAHIIGAKNRTVGETNMNDASSRSHAVFTLSVIEQRIDDRTNKMVKKTSKIHIVDLAGSERVETTGATGTRLKEGSMINQSLSALGNVINALTQPERSHVPYRDSKLTYLLSDSLGGNSLTLMLACISPVSFNYDESLSTLRFAERAKNIKNYAKINTDPMLLKIMELEAEVEDLRRRLRMCVCGAADDLSMDVGFCSTLLQNFRFRRRSRNKVKPVLDSDMPIDTVPPIVPTKNVAMRSMTESKLYSSNIKHTRAITE